VRNESVDRNHEQHEQKAGKNGRSELLPQEVHAKSDGEGHRPHEMDEAGHVLYPLCVDSHQVHYLTDSGVSAGGRAQSQGLTGIMGHMYDNDPMYVKSMFAEGIRLCRRVVFRLRQCILSLPCILHFKTLLARLGTCKGSYRSSYAAYYYYNQFIAFLFHSYFTINQVHVTRTIARHK